MRNPGDWTLTEVLIYTAVAFILGVLAGPWAWDIFVNLF